MAQEIAATASTQALEATRKLLAQSEYLQRMLDDVISKVRPNDKGQTVEDDSGKNKTKDNKETQPKKA